MNDLPADQEQIDHLESKIVNRTESFDRLALAGRKWAFAFRSLLLVISGSITILAG